VELEKLEEFVQRKELLLKELGAIVNAEIEVDTLEKKNEALSCRLKKIQQLVDEEFALLTVIGI